MIINMTFDIVFNRALNLKTDYVSPGGYEVELVDGRIIGFDFTRYEGTIDRKLKNILHVEVSGLDTESFMDADSLKSSDFVPVDASGRLQCFSEFYVYLGEEGESPGLEAKEIQKLRIAFLEDNGFSSIVVPSNLITLE